jgi:eukaryotic-like serine/threonine-protein kinase
MSETVALSPGPTSPIQPGLVIAGKYRIEQEIGRGSMGTVYRAVHVTLGQRVAIKLISTEHLQSAEMRHRFSVEAKAAARLRSRHVVQVIDDGETPEGNPYIVLELLEGETLEQRIAREHDLPLADAVRIVTHVGRALARAHAQGIVHRDLKPANVFLVKSDDDEAGWVAKVLDFGIAKIAQEASTTRAGTVLGTPLFMSPEQVRGASSVDHRADLYSLGMCLFHMLTGEYAYYSASYSEILVGICTRPLPGLREKAPWLPVPLEDWFQRACAKLPLDRFQSADEMTEALQAAAGGASPLSKHKSVPEGRIAPETLVGFAAPQLATVQIPIQELGGAHAVAVAVPSQSPAITGVEVSSRRAVRPLVVGLGLGALALASLVITLKLLNRSSAVTQPTPSAVTNGRPPAALNVTPPPPSPSSAPALTPLPHDPSVPINGALSSVAGENPALRPTRLMRQDQQKKRAPSVTSTSSPPASPLPAEAAKASGADLGF